MNFEDMRHLDVPALKRLVASGEVFMVGERYMVKADYEKYKSLEEKGNFHDRVQHTKKIFLNSLYGGLLNRYFRFSDPRFGQSTTLSGRVVTKHMCRKAGEVVDGAYDFTQSILTSDTDSCYITLNPLITEALPELKDRAADADELERLLMDQAVDLADEVGRQINESFPERMVEAFFVAPEQGGIIQAGREVVARRGLFKDVKKRYALSVFDTKGLRKGKLKIMGIETQRSDTPKFIQDFLKECLRLAVEEGHGRDRVFQYVERFRATEFRARDPWTLGIPCRVSNLSGGTRALDLFYGRIEEGRLSRAERLLTVKKSKVHYSVTASYNTNRYIEYFSDRTIPAIRDGDKVEIIQLKKGPTNPLELDTVAIPVGISVVPQWMKDLPYDVKTSQQKLIDNKLDNIFGVLKWDFRPIENAGDDCFE